MSTLPVLYSFRRCPYAMRARMAIRYAGLSVELREVVLSDKPVSMLLVSPKGTVPVLVLPDGKVIDESIDIVHWALSINDLDQWLTGYSEAQLIWLKQLVEENDFSFKLSLDKYKYAERFPEQSATYYRAEGEKFLIRLEEMLQANTFLAGDNMTVADVAVFPFVRQFAHVDKNWFYQSKYLKLQQWLDSILELVLFKDVMKKYKPWKEGAEIIMFP